MARPLRVESVPIGFAHRRVLAQPLVAAITSPPADVSAMDGYAVRDEDLAELPALLDIAGESAAGRGYEGALDPGRCVRIFTGAPVPLGATRVVVQENVTRQGEQALFETRPGAALHIRKQGSDFREGDVLLPEGQLLDARCLVAAAAADTAQLHAWARPRIVVLSSGDELAEPGSARGRPGAIPESISCGIAALAETWGGSLVRKLRLRDDLPAMESAAAAALKDADLVVVTGGASVGERDFAKAMFEPFGLHLIFSKVAMKPGKPVWLGRAAGKLVLGLPGNPTSAMVTARLLLVPLIAGLTGRDPKQALHWRQASLAGPLEASGDRETFVRATATDDGARPIENQDSGAQLALAAADLLIRRRAHAAAAEAGAGAEIVDF